MQAVWDFQLDLILFATGSFEYSANEVLPLYYDYPYRWLEIIKNSMKDIIPRFESSRMAKEYYELLYK